MAAVATLHRGDNGGSPAAVRSGRLQPHPLPLRASELMVVERKARDRTRPDDDRVLRMLGRVSAEAFAPRRTMHRQPCAHTLDQSHRLFRA